MTTPNVSKPICTLPHIVYQSADIQLDFNRRSLVGTTSLLAYFDENIEMPHYLFLNCRQCKVDKVTINGVKCSFVHNDALMQLSTACGDANGPTYNGEELDLSFRAALEVSRKGELQIDIPEHLVPSSFVPLQLPKRAPREVVSRFEKLSKIQHDLQQSEKDAVTLVVTIQYHIADPLDSWAGWSFGRFSCNDDGIHRGSRTNHRKSVISYAVTRHSSNVSLYDVDGVRTWLPCIDDPGRSCIFDISVTVPSYCEVSDPPLASSTARHSSGSDTQGPARLKYRVACSGILVAANAVSAVATGQDEERTTFRFVTPHRTPACAIGIFVGVVKDTFVVPLYQAQGHIWIADDGDIATSQEDSVKVNDKSNPSSDAVVASGSNLAARVKHTFLGFDAAVRHAHKTISRKYAYPRCTIVCIPDLECNYLSFDSFFCIDYKWLYSHSAIYMEGPCHLLLLQAYLYSWMKSALLLNSYSSEFLLHGAVGFMVNEYVEYLFGQEEARYRFYKQLQNVISYEKTSNSFPLSCPFPEDYLRCGDLFGQYLLHKSVVIFHILSHRLGGNVDVLLKAIRNIVKTKEIIKHVAGPGQTSGQVSMAPPLFPPTTPYVGHMTPMWSPTVVTTPYVASPLWTGLGNTSVSRGEDGHSRDMNVSTGLVRKRSDSIVSVGSDHGDISLSWKMDPSELKSSTLTAAAASASASPADSNTSKLGDESLADSLLPPPALVRQASTASSVGGNPSSSFEEIVWGTDYNGGGASGVSFLADIRDMSGGAGADLNEIFLDQWVNTPGCMFLRAGVHVDTRNKKVDIALHQALCSHSLIVVECLYCCVMYISVWVIIGGVSVW